MKKIYIPQGGGRDFWLRIPMNNESAGRHLCMDDVDENEMHVWLESGYGGCWTLVWEKDGAQRDGIAAKVPASQLGYGTYSVVMAGKFVNGDYFRTKRQLFIRLVDREDQADAEPTMYNEEQAYWAGPAVLSEMLSRDGLNTYELAVIHGFEGTLEEYLEISGLELQDLMVTKAKLSREVQTQLDRGSEKAITPKGDYSASATYAVNDLVYVPEVNASYVSLISVNEDNYPPYYCDGDDACWMKTTDGEYIVGRQVSEISSALTGYFTCGTEGNVSNKQVSNSSDYHREVNGGAMKVKMANANTASNVKMQFANDVSPITLLYNGETVDENNTWEDGDVISVYYDGTYNNNAGAYFASNAQGGGGKAEKIKYDNSQSGLALTNVQGALDEVASNNSNLYASKVWTTSNNNAIRNGSVGNGGNALCVAVTKIIDVSDLKRIKLVTNRPNSENCVYRWIYTTFSITSGNSNSQTNRIRIFDGYSTINNPSEFGLLEQEVGFAFGVLEWNTITNTASALRVGDFSGYVIGFEGVKKEPKYDYPVLQEGTSLTLDLFKMDVGSLQASGVIASAWGGAFTSFPIELTTTQSITVTLPTTTIGETEIVPQLRIAEFDSVDCKNGSLIYNATPTGNYTFTPTKKFIRIHLGWWEHDMLTIKNGFGGLQISSTSKLRVLDIPTRQLPVFPFHDVTYIPSPSVRTGSVGNIDNSYTVSTSYVIPTYGHKYAMIYTSYKPQDGCVLRFVSCGLTVDNGKSEVASVAANRVFYGDYNGNNIISDVSDAIGIAFSIVEYNLSTGTYTGRDTLLSALNEEHFGIILFDEYTSIAHYLDKDAILNASVTELNGANNVKNLLAQATRYPRVRQTQKTKPLTLLHFSDMHGSASALRRIIAFKNEWAAYINDILNTGDTIYLRYSNDWTWFTNISGSENILMTIGNHDALAATSGWDWTNLITPQQGYERYMAGIANWGVVYEENKTYYYKDYTTEKIRLIVLDCMLWDSTQLEWLTNTLASAKTAGLSVVIATHYPPLIDGLENCSFNSPYVGNDRVSPDAVAAVDSFISSQGEFIAWVCGHTHWDKFGTVQNYPNQTVVVVDTCATDADNLAYSDVARVDGTKSQDLFNIIAFDTWEKRIKLIRIGADYDYMMRHKGTLCWDYNNQKLLWNT